MLSIYINKYDKFRWIPQVLGGKFFLAKHGQPAMERSVYTRKSEVQSGPVAQEQADLWRVAAEPTPRTKVQGMRSGSQWWGFVPPA